MSGKPVRQTLGRASLVAATVLAALLLTGCVRSGHHPNELGIPEARAAARDQIESLSSALRFTDRVVVLGTGERDSCGAAHNWWFDNDDPGYRCWMQWTAVAVIPDATTSAAVAAAIDDEFEVLGLAYPPGSAVASFMAQYPRDRQPDSYMRVVTGGHEGRIRLDVEATTFRADTWPPPSIKSSTHGNIGGSGDASDITVEDVRATGAVATVEITLSTEYWNAAGLTEAEEGPASEAKHWERTSWGDAYVVEIADWAPADAQWEACVADPAIDQTTVTRVEQPFPYVRATLLPAATPADLQRIGECIWPTLSAGTLVTYDPYE